MHRYIVRNTAPRRSMEASSLLSGEKVSMFPLRTHRVNYRSSMRLPSLDPRPLSAFGQHEEKSVTGLCGGISARAPRRRVLYRRRSLRVSPSFMQPTGSWNWCKRWNSMRKEGLIGAGSMVRVYTDVTGTASIFSTGAADVPQHPVESSLPLLGKWVASMRQSVHPVGEWAQVPSKRTINQMRRSLEAAIREGTVEHYSELVSTMRQWHEVRTGHRLTSEFLLLYTRALVNFGAFSLVSSEAGQAEGHLQKAITILDCAIMLRAKERMGSNDVFAHKEVKDDTQCREFQCSSASAIHVRVLLANALMISERYWDAFQEYILALQTMQQHVFEHPLQIAPGPTGQQLLSTEFVQEDFQQFMGRPERVELAIAQGKARLLLLLSGGEDESGRMMEQLNYARLHRFAGRHEQSRRLYETYLVQVEAKEGVSAMLELGRLIAFTCKEGPAGLPYLESAAEFLMEDVIHLLDAPRSDASITLRRLAVCASGALVDISLVLHAKRETGRALGVMELALNLLHRTGQAQLSAWIMMHYADMLVSVSLVHEAVGYYLEAMRLLSAETVVRYQVASNGQWASLGPAEVEAHLAYCMQTWVEDYQRAMQHYEPVMRQCKPHMMANSSAVRCVGGSIDAAGVVDLTTRHWVLSNYSVCCERTGQWNTLQETQIELMRLAGDVGADLTPYVLRGYDACTGELGNNEGEDVCDQALLSIHNVVSSDALVILAHDLAERLHCAGGIQSQSHLLDAVLEVRGELMPLDVCMLASKLFSSTSPSVVTMQTNSTHLNFLSRAFCRAANIAVALYEANVADRGAMSPRDALCSPGLTRNNRSSVMGLLYAEQFFRVQGQAAEAKEMRKAVLLLSGCMEEDGNQDTLDDQELAVLLLQYPAGRLSISPSLQKYVATLRSLIGHHPNSTRTAVATGGARQYDNPLCYLKQVAMVQKEVNFNDA